MATSTRRIELLAPARNKEIAIEAITHGADAVYMGAHSFGARVAAGNSLDDMAQVVCDILGVKSRFFRKTRSLINYDYSEPKHRILQNHVIYD